MNTGMQNPRRWSEGATVPEYIHEGNDLFFIVWARQSIDTSLHWALWVRNNNGGDKKLSGGDSCTFFIGGFGLLEASTEAVTGILALALGLLDFDWLLGLDFEVVTWPLLITWKGWILVKICSH